MSPLSRREFFVARDRRGRRRAGGCLRAGSTTSVITSRRTHRHHPSPADTKSILIVGAGVAGLAAARSLTDAGWPVRVIEARDRIGGRVYTDRDWGVPIEMGASWIHGTANDPMMELARNAGRSSSRPTTRDGRSSRWIPNCGR